jgi:nitrogen regulatory protein P-II 1
MKEIKAFVHRNRIADVVRALKSAAFDRLSVIDVKGMLKAMDEKERDYSVELGEKVITEVKLELVCENDARASEAIDIIQKQADTGQTEAGWIYVSEIQSVLRIGKE